jgi:dephospho-CoA kinase
VYLATVLKIVGITGGIGSGKTLVCQVFKSLSVPVFHADDEAKRCYDDEQIKDQVKSLFGEEIYYRDSINRELLAAAIFTDQLKLQSLNNIIHPAVAVRFESWMKTQVGAYIIKEAAILFESGSYKNCDKTITVTAPAEMRINRVMERDHADRQSVEARLRNQWSDDKKVELSDFVIINDGSEALVPQVDVIHRQLINPGG